MTRRSNMEEIERPPSLSDLATDKLRGAISGGEFELGEALSEQKLANRLNISKTPIRHALAQMRVEGLVDVFPQKGTFVFTLSGTDLKGFAEFRGILETSALRLAYERNRSDLVLALENSCHAMQVAKSKNRISQYLNLDTQFHRTFFELCENDLLLEHYGLIEAKVSAIRTHVGRYHAQTDLSFQEHAEMVDALKAGNLEGCSKKLVYHIGRFILAYREDQMKSDPSGRR